jgi:predicted amidophosphoribosyltransferase
MQETIAKSVNATRRSRVAAPFRAFFGRALDIALPTLCPACREPVGGNGLCAPCWSKLSLIAPPYCERLGIPFAYDPGPGVLSMQAITDPPAYHRARAAVRYNDIARTLVHALKYGDRLDLAPTMGRWMARAGRELLADADALIPVPLHWRRLWARPFNQSALLAKAIGQESGVRSPTPPSNASRRPRSKSVCRRPSAPKTYRAPFAYPPSARPKWPAAVSF